MEQRTSSWAIIAITINVANIIVKLAPPLVTVLLLLN